MRVLSRHFLASYLRLFATVLFASLVVIAIVEVLLNSDELLGGGATVSGIASYLFLRLPSYYFRDLVPVSSFAAALLCVGLAARSREVTAARAGGIPPQRMVVPILGAATALSLAAFLLDESVVLATAREWNGRDDRRGTEVAYRQGAFWYRRGDTIFNVEEADPTTGTLRGVRIFETDPDGRLRRSLRADVVEVDGDERWHLRDALVRTFDPSLPAAAPHSERRDETVPASMADRDLALLDASARTLSLRELADYIRGRAEAGRDTAHQREMLNARLAQPWSVVAFALVAIPLGLGAERRRGLAVGALAGVAILGVFYAARTAASILAASGVAAAATGPWWTLAALLALGSLRFARSPR